MGKVEKNISDQESQEGPYGYPDSLWALLTAYQQRIIAGLHNLISADQPVDPELQERIDEFVDKPQ